MPGGSKKATGFPNPSAMAWIFVFRPPFVSPMALFSTFFPTVRTLVNFNASLIHAEVSRISFLIQFRKDIFQDAVIPPLYKAGINTLPRTVAQWELPPLRPAVIHPEHPVQHRPVNFPGASLLPCVFRREQRLNSLPLFICKIIAVIVIHAFMIPCVCFLCNFYFSNKV